MPLETDGFDSLMTDIAGMASRMDADGSGAPWPNAFWKLRPSPSISR